MSIRHIHARPGQYIAVHRNGGSHHSSSSGMDPENAVNILHFIIFIAICYWIYPPFAYIILLIFFVLFCLLAIIYHFDKIVLFLFHLLKLFGIALLYCGKMLYKATIFLAYHGGRAIWEGCQRLFAYLQRRKSAQPPDIPPMQAPSRPATYGKIIQKF